MSNISSLPAFELLPYEDSNPAPCKSITLERTSSWMYCGPILPLTDSQLPPSYHDWHKATINGSLTATLLSFLSHAHTFLSAAGINHYWLTIRATKPTTDYNHPRWHTDEDFFHNRRMIRTQWKLVTTLLGPGTLFIQDEKAARTLEQRIKSDIGQQHKDHLCTSFSCLGCATASAAVRNRLADEFLGQKIIQATNSDICFFKIGQEKGAVHSEPPQDCDRVFVNIVPGTDIELRDLMAKWGMTTFPRSWCNGLPMRPH